MIVVEPVWNIVTQEGFAALFYDNTHRDVREGFFY